MILSLFVSVIHLNKERIVWQKGAGHHWFVEIRQSFRLFINIQQISGVEIINDFTTIVDKIDVEFSAILITNRKNIALIVLFDQTHFEIVSIIVILEHELISAKAEAKNLVVHITFVTDGYSIFWIIRYDHVYDINFRLNVRPLGEVREELTILIELLQTVYSRLVRGTRAHHGFTFVILTTAFGH